MPIYEYVCKSCGKHFETMQKISEPPIAPCPKCGDTADRAISRTSFTLKGSGWYKDGYSKQKPKGTEGEQTKPDAKKDSGKKDESKPKK